MKLNLQFFANGEAAGHEQPVPQGQDAEPQAAENTQENGQQDVKPGEGKPLDLVALLKSDKAFQGQVDQHVAKAINTALTNAREKWEKEKGMSAEELAAQATQEREDALAQREQDIQTREMRVAALAMLSDKGLPVALVESISLADEEAMEASLEAVERAFRASVDSAVKERMKGTAPKDQGNTISTQLARMRAAAGLKD